MGYIIEAADRFVKIDRSEASIIADMLIEELARTFETKPESVKAPEVSKTFEIGSTYGTSFNCDSDTFAFFKIVGRTPKQIKFVQIYNGQPEGKVKRVKIFSDNSGEYFLPFGSYSMSMLIRTHDKIEKS